VTIGSQPWVSVPLFDDVLHARDELQKENAALRELSERQNREIQSLQAEIRHLNVQLLAQDGEKPPKPAENEALEAQTTRFHILEASCAALGEQIHELERRFCLPDDKINAVHARINRLEAILRPAGSPAASA
jgi:chromosome segregation ATPase